jgi:predicted house-cleaning noncanonical NTP pyrophosphatase (MazG superfamily)
MAEEDVLREIAPQILAIQNAPVAPDRRSSLAKRIGRKAAGLALLPSEWTPPFIVIEGAIYERWRDASPARAAAFIIATVAEIAAQEARKWDARWDRGVTVRSSATEETLSERGSNDSVELAADYDGAMIARAILQVFQRFLSDGSPGAMAIVVQARVPHLALGHMSNEQRVSKTINQWMWEYEPADKPGGRFNSQRDTPPDEALQLRPFGHRPSDFTKLFRKIGRWCTRLHAGRTHLEWGATVDDLWLFQLDFEEDQPEKGVDPTAFLRDGDFRPPGELPMGSPFQVASLTGQAGWRKIDKAADFSADRAGYPTLIHITGDKFLKSFADGYDFARDLEGFAHGRVVCRTDCKASGVSSLNLPRTHTVGFVEAVSFITKTISDFGAAGVSAENLCFILHKFIPSVTAAWAVARKDSQIVRVDSLWGLPDGLQYLPHDSYEYDVRRKQQSSERLRYKHAFLQEAPTGLWEVVRVARRATRWRSLPTPDLAEVALRTHEIAHRLGRDIQIMWFCQVPEETGLQRNIPWFSMAPAEHSPKERSVSPAKKRFVIRSMSDLEKAAALNKAGYLLQLDPDDPELFRSQAFLDKVIAVAKDRDFPVGLTGSILGHAFYVIEKAGVPVIALNEPTRSRTRQRRVFRKLVRDDIPNKITEGGETVTLAEIAKEEARAALVGKLLEESYELLAADTPQDVTAELADLLEVVRSLANITGVDWSDVQEAANQKRVSRGGFERNVVLLETAWPGWLAENRQSARFTIPLGQLGQISEQDGTFTVPFPSLLAAGPSPIIRLEDGTRLEITMGGSGVRVSPVSEKNDDEKQAAFEF